MDSAEERLLARRRIDDSTGCWIWTGYCEPFGHGAMALNGRKERVHRVAAFVWLDLDLLSDLHVLHLCDNLPCFNPDHLYLGTNADNMRDRVNAGSYGNGKSGKRKLQDDDVRKVLYLLTEGMSQHQIAKIMGVTQPTIRAIVIGRTHKHIER